MTDQRLDELLRDYEADVARVLSPPWWHDLPPGVDEATVRAALVPEGIEPSPQLLSWFAWHCPPDHPVRHPPCVAENWTMMSLSSIVNYLEFIRYDEYDVIPTSWCPLLHSGGPETLCLDTGSTQRPGDVIEVSSHKDNFSPGDIYDVVTEWRRQLHDGIWAVKGNRIGLASPDHKYPPDVVEQYNYNYINNPRPGSEYYRA